jgi:hypothetical protein
MEEEHSVIVPVLNDNLTIMSFVVPKDFAMEVEMHASRLIEAFDRHPAGEGMDPNNKMMQALSFMFQSALEQYIELTEEDIDEHPPEISDL